MTQENKDLLLKDLCARLPYGVKAEKYTIRMDGEFVPLADVEIVTTKDIITLNEHPGYTIKPYLFSLSNMTEEQKKEFDQLLELELKAINDEIDHIQATVFEVDFYNKYHFDWRNLIPLGLANDASGKNIY